MSEIASAQLLLVTTPDVSGWTISRTYGLVTSEEAVTAGPIGDLSNSLHAIVGGNLPAAAELISEAKDRVLLSARMQAFRLGANALVGCRIDYAIDRAITLVSFSGTAVRIDSDHGEYLPSSPTTQEAFVETTCESCGLVIPWMEPNCVGCATPRPEPASK